MMPPRTISAIYAPVFIDTMISPETVTSSVAPSLRSAKPQKMTIACTIIGVPRNISTYADNMKSPTFFSARRNLFFGLSSVRYMPISTPMSKPARVPTTATSIVYPTPLSIQR